MQSVSSRIWTRVAVSISCDDEHYTTGIDLALTYNGWYAVKPKQPTNDQLYNIKSYKNRPLLYLY